MLILITSAALATTLDCDFGDAPEPFAGANPLTSPPGSITPFGSCHSVCSDSGADFTCDLSNWSKCGSAVTTSTYVITGYSASHDAVAFGTCDDPVAGTGGWCCTLDSSTVTNATINLTNTPATVDEASLLWPDSALPTHQFSAWNSTLNVTVNGNGGEDTIHGAFTDDPSYLETLNGNEDNDTIYGWAGSDTLTGGDGDDALSGGEGDDLLIGGDGHDALLGEQDVDTLCDTTGTVSCNLPFGDLLHGGADDDYLWFDDTAACPFVGNDALIDGDTGTDECGDLGLPFFFVPPPACDLALAAAPAACP